MFGAGVLPSAIGPDLHSGENGVSARRSAVEHRESTFEPTACGLYLYDGTKVVKIGEIAKQKRKYFGKILNNIE